MVDFSDRENIKRWLDAIKPAKRRREIAVALAARASLRMTPLLGRALTQAERSQATVLSDFVLSPLRATALSWAAAKYPAHGGELRSADLAAALAASKAAAAARGAARAAATTVRTLARFAPDGVGIDVTCRLQPTQQPLEHHGCRSFSAARSPPAFASDSHMYAPCFVFP
jgi:hypothetical protein